MFPAVEKPARMLKFRSGRDGRNTGYPSNYDHLLKPNGELNLRSIILESWRKMQRNNLRNKNAAWVNYEVKYDL